MKELQNVTTDYGTISASEIVSILVQEDHETENREYRLFCCVNDIANRVYKSCESDYLRRLNKTIAYLMYNGCEKALQRVYDSDTATPETDEENRIFHYLTSGSGSIRCEDLSEWLQNLIDLVYERGFSDGYENALLDVPERMQTVKK